MKTGAAAVLALVLFFGNGPDLYGQPAEPAPPAPAAEDAPEEGIAMEIEKLRLSDEEFWKDGDRYLDPIVEELGDKHFGVVLDAPRLVPLADRKTLPAFLYYMGSHRQVATRDFKAHGLVVAVDPDANRLYFAHAARPANPGEPRRDDRPVREGGPPGEAPAAPGAPEGYSASIYEVDLAALLKLPWRPAEYLVSPILLDMPGNRVRTRLVLSRAQYEDPEVAKFLAAERAKLDPPAPNPTASPDRPLPRWKRSADTPPRPEGLGLALRAPRVCALDPGLEVPLEGSFRVPVMPEDLVKADHADYNRRAGLAGAKAVVTISLLVTCSASPTPIPARIAVPVTEVAEGPDGVKTAAGEFAVNLLSLLEIPERAQTWFVYGFCREAFTGPVPVGFADRAALPGR